MIPIETLNEIVTLARESREPFLLKTQPDSRKLYYCHDGHLKSVDRAPDPISHVVETTLDLATLANESDNEAMIFVGPDVVVCLLDREDRRDHVKMPLVRSDVFVSASKGFNGKPKDAVKWLRAKLGMEPTPDNVVGRLSVVDFKTLKTERSAAVHGASTTGHSVESEVEQREQIPNRFELNTVVFMNPDLRKEVTLPMLVELDPELGSVSIMPAADALGRALIEARTGVVGTLRGHTNEAIRIVVGAP